MASDHCEQDFGPLSFFQAQKLAFVNTLRQGAGRENVIDALLTQAYDSFERNVEIQTEDMSPLACRRGCATCCTLRVTASAPEALMIGRYIRWSQELLAQQEISLAERVRAADIKTRGLDEAERVALRLRCPYIQQGSCLIYQVRPLACRGHASYDVRACVEAAAGRADQVPYSQPHIIVRSLVQNAMQSALRDSGLAYGLYELNHAVTMVLDQEGACSQWLAGSDVFAPAQVGEVSAEEMARTYDSIGCM